MSQDRPVKSLGFILSYLATPQARRSGRIFGWMLGILALIVGIYSTLFHEIMKHEGQAYSWITAVYWTVVTMSTLGYGDIAFESDLGRLFSLVVLLSGSVFILVLLPFTFIQFVFLPWMESSQRARTPRQVDDHVRDHVVFTSTGPIESALINRLDRAGIGYVTLVGEVDEALRLHDDGVRVIVGDFDDPDAYRSAGVERAALVVSTRPDTSNTNAAFTVREIAPEVKIAATANSGASVDVLQLAGCDEVLRLGEMLGSALGRRVLGPNGRSQVIGRFGDVLIAEAVTPPVLDGTTLAQTEIRGRTGLTVAGIWHRGRLEVARPATVLRAGNILVLAGSRAHLDTYDELFAADDRAASRALILGGGRVGRAVGRYLEDQEIDFRIVEQRPERVGDPERSIVGDAADIDVLRAAGLDQASAVVITTHDDDMNIYLTNYCRRLRPDIQIIARSRLDRNVTTLHRAGADSVLSYASTGATALWNMLTDENTLQLAEGLEVFRVPVPDSLSGSTLERSNIREATGCTIIAVVDQGFHVNPPADTMLPAGADLVLIGDSASEDRFLTRYRTRPER